MARDFPRSRQVAEQIQRELADLLQFELKDPRVGMATITEVDVSGDLAHAKIYIVAHENAEETLKGLQSAAGFLRTQLSKRLSLRSVPQLHFVYDSTMERGLKLSQLIDQAMEADGKTHSP